VLSRLLTITKPGIAGGVALSGLAGMALAARGLPDRGTLLACTVCIVLAATGSAILNVVFEEKTDALMPRVSKRAEALARIGAGRAATLAIILIASSVIASFFLLNEVTALLIISAVVSYTFVYTLFLKKSSPYGTVTGGIPGALPALIGYSAVTSRIGVDGFILFFVMLLWQQPHFLALALKHRRQYAAAGIPVMPVVLGEQYTKAFIFIYATALLPLPLALFIFGYCSVYFAVFSVSLGIFLLAFYYIQIVRRNAYGRAFGASIFYIIALLAAVVADLGMGLNQSCADFSGTGPTTCRPFSDRGPCVSSRLSRCQSHLRRLPESPTSPRSRP